MVASGINHKVGPLKCTSLCSAAAVKTHLRGFEDFFFLFFFDRSRGGFLTFGLQPF